MPGIQCMTWFNLGVQAMVKWRVAICVFEPTKNKNPAEPQDFEGRAGIMSEPEFGPKILSEAVENSANSHYSNTKLCY